MKTIQLTRGQVAFVDDADFEAVNQFKWHALKARHGFYAARSIREPDGTRGYQYLHQFLMPGVAQIDHRDGNRLNDQRGNLRPATTRQNLQGFQQKKIGASSKFRGVYWFKLRLKWRAEIQVEGKKIHLGLFEKEPDAARAYNEAAIKYFGEFAHLNII